MGGSGPLDPITGEADELGCELITAITGNLAGMARGMLADWQGGRQDFVRVMATPGDDNPPSLRLPKDRTQSGRSLGGGLN
ncbi:MAG: hypothetical protein R3310_08195 [Candidatus Competibacteraceae bacterium]|nr:hypothetical protein [Candidatus Competibacteraceae bacterium]